MRPEGEEDELAYERAFMAVADQAREDLVKSAYLDRNPVAAFERYSASLAHRAIVATLTREGVVAPARILEVGGGRGLASAALAAEGFDVTLLEPNKSHLVGSRAAADLRRSLSLEFDIIDLSVEEYGGASFDVVFCRAVLHHFDDLSSGCAAMTEHLRRGGLFLAADEPIVWSDWGRRRLVRRHPFTPFGVREWAYKPRDYRRALKAAGVGSISIRPTVPVRDYVEDLLRRHPGMSAAPRFIRAPVVGALFLRSRIRTEFASDTGRSRLISGRKH